MTSSDQAQTQTLQQALDNLLGSYTAKNFVLAEQQARVLTHQYPNHPLAWKVLGRVLIQKGELEAALVAMQRSVLLDPDDAQAFYNLGQTQHQRGELNAAEKSYNAAIRLQPDHVDARVNLGVIYQVRGRFIAAEAMYRSAIERNPNMARAHNNLGNTLKDLGRLPEAMTSYREALRLKSWDAKTFSNLLFSLNYFESLSPEAALMEAKRYGARVSSASVPKFVHGEANIHPNKLRVGFVSGDLRHHPVGYFCEGLIKHLDPTQFELYAFPTHHKEDALTARIKPCFKRWLPIFSKTDAEAAELIYDNKIQVLIDLSGHSAHNRLPVFSYRPAPVQASWLGYFATTGLPEMDFFIGDPVMLPEDEVEHFTEKVWPLAETWLCLAPPAELVPIEQLPALKNGYVTFGCFGNLVKMNDAVVELWAQVLQKLPSSKLRLKAKQLAETRVAEAVLGRFGEHGITQDRLILERPTTHQDYFAAYNRVDMVLDTFPYPGGTTSVDALWMGVPVLTLKGERFLSHLGESIAINSGQSAWIAQDAQDFVTKAVAFAGDLEGLAALRKNLRGQVLSSPLMDAPRFAQNFANAIQGMWAWHLNKKLMSSGLGDGLTSEKNTNEGNSKMKLNMGCGQNKVPGFVNIDKFKECSPDLQMDLEVTPWSLPDNSVEEVLFNHCLEHLGATSDVFFGIIKELYRVCVPNAKIQINVPHPRHDNFIGDPTHVRIITPQVMSLFSKKNNEKWKAMHASNTPLALYLGVDFEVERTELLPAEQYRDDLVSGKLSRAEFDRLALTTNNAISEIRMTVRAIKS
jgi:predicted O-linked N-acetylglucosamine transferase (SPINDLY family)